MKIGDVIVTEGERKSIVSRLIAYFSGSWATHVFVVTGPDEAVEARFPRVRKFALQDRLYELEQQGRAYAVLDIHQLTTESREAVAAEARGYVGRFYDFGQILMFMLTRRFWQDGSGTLTCSRLVTSAYLEGARVNLFPARLLSQYPPDHHRLPDLKLGYAAPVDLLVSRLALRFFHPSKTAPTLTHLLTSKSPTLTSILTLDTEPV
jgi:hypothetical protein